MREMNKHAYMYANEEVSGDMPTDANADGVCDTPLSLDKSINTLQIEDLNLSEADVDSLIYMYQEEKLAMDVYDLFAQEYDSTVFDKISDSEEKHMSIVEDTLLANDIDITELQSLDDGEYLDENLQELYNTLTQEGLVSYEDAIGVGVTIENADIADLEEYLVEDVTLSGIYTNLDSGSHNHLSAFESLSA